MTEFIDEIKERANEALASLERARSEDDDYAVLLHTGQLESIARLADDHGVTIPGLQEFNAA